MISLEWIRFIGHVACIDMAGFLCSLVSMVPSPWAVDASESAAYLLEVALGRYSSGLVAEWSPSDGFHEAQAVSSVPDHPNVWTDGSFVLDRVTDVSSSGAGFFAHQSEDCWRGRRWGHIDGLRADEEVSSCGGFCSVPGPLQSVQRAEM